MIDFIEQIKDELDGAMEYIEFAEEYPEYAEMFNRMAKDEFKHAGFIRDMAEDADEDLEEIVDDWETVEECINDL